MEHWLWIILAALFFECKGEDKVIQPQEDVIATEGDTLTLSCTFETNINYGAYLFWYKKEENYFPKYVLRRDTTGTPDNAQDFPQVRFDAELKDKSVPLKISSAAVSDSAVYYCALRNDVKMIFGRGTRLTVEPKETYEPSYYALGDESTKVCLATGFSRYNVTHNHAAYGDPFIKTEPVRISEDSLFNQVAFIDDTVNCTSKESDDAVCADTLEPDPTVNLVSLTIIGLRVIFLKTIIFNVLMTLRLWISQ